MVAPILMTIFVHVFQMIQGKKLGKIGQQKFCVRGARPRGTGLNLPSHLVIGKIIKLVFHTFQNIAHILGPKTKFGKKNKFNGGMGVACH